MKKNNDIEQLEKSKIILSKWEKIYAEDRNSAISNIIVSLYLDFRSVISDHERVIKYVGEVLGYELNSGESTILKNAYESSVI